MCVCDVDEVILDCDNSVLWCRCVFIPPGCPQKFCRHKVAVSISGWFGWLRVCLCVCVCVCERAGERRVSVGLGPDSLGVSRCLNGVASPSVAPVAVEVVLVRL